MNSSIPDFFTDAVIIGPDSPNVLEGYEDDDREHFYRLGYSVVNTLQSWKDAGYVIIALTNIKNNFDNDIFQDFLISKKIEGLVFKVMESLTTYPAVQILGCQLIDTFFERSEHLKKNLLSCDTHRHLMRLLKGNSSDVLLQTAILKTLEKLISFEEVRVDVVLDEAIVDMTVQMFTCLHTFTDNRQIKQTAYSILKFLCEEKDQDVYDICVQKENLDLLSDDLSIIHQENEGCMITVEVVTILIFVSRGAKHLNDATKNYRSLLMENNIHNKLLKLLQHSSNGEVLSVCLKFLAVFCKDESMTKFIFESGYLRNNLIATMVQWIKNAAVVKEGLKLFIMLACSRTGNILSINGFVPQWCKVVYEALSKHLEDASIQAYACKAVAVMLENKQEATVWIGENTQGKLAQEPIHTACMGAMLIHRNDPNVFTTACQAIYWLAADNERLCSSLFAKNIHTVIIDGLKLHMKHHRAAEAGLKALRALCIFNDDHKRELVLDERIFSMISEIIDKFPQRQSLQLEATSTLACIANIDTVRYQCFLKDIHIKIIQTLERFSETETMQEVGIECLTVLCAAENAAEMLNMAGATRHTIKMLKKYSDMVYLQKKGLILIQLLAEKKLCRDPEVCDGLAEIICEALETHADNNGVLKEACVAVQILAETGQEISNSLIDRGCHKILFEILQTNQDTELQDLICECLCVMGLTLDLKSKMLCTCTKGVLVGAECLLELGADVNYTDGENTPLCQAVRNQDEDLVRLLLKKGITDLHKPLQLSLELGMDTDVGNIIIGHILGCIGDRTGKQALWNNLSLETLKSEWMTVAFAKILRNESDLSKKLALRIRNSFNRKHQRLLAYAKSESDIWTFGRHKFFRYRFKSDSELPIEESANDFDETLESLVPMRNKVHKVFSDSVLKRRRQTMPITGSIHKNLSPIMSPRHSLQWPINSMSRLDNQLSAPVSPTDHANFSISLKEDEPFQSESESIVFPVFESSRNEVDEWKKETLTGANVPFNPADPRHRGSTEKSYPEILSGKWSRISRSPSPRAGLSRNSSTEHLDTSTTDSPQSYLPMMIPESDMSDSNIVKRINDCLGGRNSSIDSLFSDNESRRSGVELSKNFEVTLIDLSNNRLNDLQCLNDNDLWSKFTCLQKINLNYNCLKSMPEDIFSCLPTLEQFEAKNNHIDKIPLSLWKCPALKHLDLGDNKLLSMGAFDKTWQNGTITYLDLSSNDITEIPADLSYCLPSLKYLFINCNKIYALPEEPLSLGELKVFDASNNYLKVIPEMFFHGCTRLDTLDLENNNIDSLPKENVTAMLPRLTKLKLKRNCLSEKEPLCIPKFVLELPSLRKLDLSDNKIINFPCPALWRSQMIQEIKLSRNKITKLNLDGAKTWTKLETLAIDSNSINELPKEIGQLTSLTSLDISFNKSVKTLPDEMGRCSRLWEFRYRKVDLHLDRSLANGRVKDLISFLHNRLKKATAYFRMKVMVVGYGGRGKSTLLRALMKVPKPAAHNTPTVGIIVKDWIFERYRKDFGKKVLYTLSTWDFAGQEEFYSTHQCYLSNRALYMVVLKMHKGIEEVDLLKPWLSNIFARAPGCPVIVVGTHLDKVHKSKRTEVISQFINKLNDLRFKPGFPDIHEFCPVDCSLEKDNVELERLKEKIKDVIDNYKVRGEPVMGQMVPASYVKLSERLAEEAKSLLKKSYPIIRHNQLLKIVRQSAIDLDEDELKQAVSFLHEFGILLHYEDTSLQLKDLYFIDPGWLCRMMAQVITVRQINPFIKNGILRKTDTKILFTGKKVDKEHQFIYPPSLIPQYLKLLEKFEIALPHSESELLIPCYLPDKKPALQLPLIRKHEKICRYYIMPYVQLGLWPRLITRLITFSNSFLTKILLEVDKQPTIHYWKGGVCSVWSEKAFYLVEFHSNEKEEIHVTVPNTRHGAGLLGLLVDHLDSLIEEWYPGLTTIDPYLGRELLEKLVPCVGCSGQNINKFRLDDLLAKTEQEGTVYCDVHGGLVKISALAPELVFMDLNSDLIMDRSQLEFDESEDKLLGDGGYGAVYKAVYKNQPVAVKVFAAIGDIHPLKMLRQEATVLRCLKHPSVVSLLAVGINPRVMILELAKDLSLGSVLKQEGKLEQLLQYKIALQVAEGLAYLHQMMIIYRDMKPDNVLIFSQDPKALVNAKISDYGIARFSMLDGLMLQEGTLAYRAPEVIRGETYSFKADVFSYGITLYTLLANGRHPFSEFECKGEMDKAIAEGIPVRPITEKGCTPWPLMQTLLMDCLHQGPDQRPESSVICERLKEPEVLSLKQTIPVSKGLTVECLTVQETESHELKLWAASGNSECAQLSSLDLQLNTQMEPQGAIFKHGRILCLLPLKEDHLLIGTEECRIWLYNTNSRECIQKTAPLTDAVLCMRYMPGKRWSKDDIIFVGLANGTVAVFLLSDIQHEAAAIPMCMSPGNERQVVKCMEVSHKDKRLYLTCGSNMIIMTTRTSIAIEKKVETGDPKHPSQILHMVLGSKKVMLSHTKSSMLQIRNTADLKLRTTLNISHMFSLGKDSARITSLALQDSMGIVWIGTGSGHVGLVDVNKQTLILLTHKFTSPVRSLLSINRKGCSVVVSGGLGFQDKDHTNIPIDENYGCIAVWDGEIHNNIQQQKSELKQRKQLIDNYLSL